MHHDTNCNRKTFTFSDLQKNQLRSLLSRHESKADELIAEWEDEANQYVELWVLPSHVRRESPAQRRKKFESLSKSFHTLLGKLHEMENNNDSDLIEYAIINHYDEDPCDILDSLKNQLDKIARSLDSFLKLDLKEVKKLSPTDLDIPLSDEEEHALFFGWAVARVSPKRGAPEHSTELFFIGRLAKVYSDVIHKRPGASTSSIFPNLVDYVMMYINSFVTPDSDDNVQPHSYLRLVKKAVSRL